MSILHLIVRRHAMTPSPARRAQRGCTVPPFLREVRDAAATGAAHMSAPAPGVRRGVDDTQHRESSAPSVPGTATIVFHRRPSP